MTEPRASRSTRTDWLNAGLEILARHGDRGLTVETMCVRMGKTKGSFYHHFADREDFIGRLMEHWESSFTGSIIEDLEPLGDPRTRLRVLGERTVREVDLKLERMLRIWGDREPLVRAVVERVDRSRERYLREQFEAATGDPHGALLAARTHLALLVGTQMLYQDLSHRELHELNTFVDHLGFAFEPDSRRARDPEETP